MWKRAERYRLNQHHVDSREEQTEIIKCLQSMYRLENEAKLKEGNLEITEVGLGSVRLL